ncbi:S9 family peptidase [Paenibacillus sp. J22TS3]|uniref:alpha/beta hydrolase family protein n=1 Tax=Paenibacillus sp. J22TS3 TaxID=2807192 RepID=UPI001AFE01CD|nr:prolyl oligopeptidase family serine peptidase [Paenibacillus sp. J22TS3]GIP21334.1 hypothetical protein J22TS3_16090 [Paenibacillus sp. J22TS3]
MMIFKITYISGGYKVKGYLALPEGYDIPLPKLQSWISGFYSADSDLETIRTAESINRASSDLMSRKWPVFIYCRGGMGNFGSVRTSWLEHFTRHGHIVFAPCYRGNESGEGRDEFGGADREDVFSAFRLLQNFPFVDENRISVMGFSRGSINAALTAAELKDTHRLILWSGVSDLAKTYEERISLRRMLKRVLGGTPARRPGAYAARSPIQFAERIHCPVLIMHGTSDVQVDYSHGLTMYHKLMELGMTAELHSYSGYGHIFPLAKHLEAVERMFRWIQDPATDRQT